MRWEWVQWKTDRELGPLFGPSGAKILANGSSKNWAQPGSDLNPYSTRYIEYCYTELLDAMYEDKVS